MASGGTKTSGATLIAMIFAFACHTRAEPTSLPAREPSGTIREAVHVGSWYPGDAASLRQTLEKKLAAHPVPEDAAPIIALLGPHAGLTYSGSVAAAGYQQLRSQKVRRAFLLGPTHHVGFDGVALPAADISAYATPLAHLRIDTRAVAALRGKPGFGGPAGAHGPEHSLEMHTLFLAAIHPNALLVPLVVGRLGSTKQVRIIADHLRPLLQPDDVVLISSDFTHYGDRFGYRPFRDQAAQRLLALLDAAYTPIARLSLAGFENHLSKTGDTICGREPIRILLALLPADSRAIRVAQDTSGRMTGDYDNSVSYLTVAFRREGGWPSRQGGSVAKEQTHGRQVLDAKQQVKALAMVRTTLEALLKQQKTVDDDALDVPEVGPFQHNYAVFVTLKRNGQLRGCIGHILPVQPLWRDLRDNAIAAAIKDPRFPPVTASELDELHIEISVLTQPQAIARPEQFVVGRHGIILSAHGRRSVYLPQVAPEQGWDRSTTLSHLARKAGLPADVWTTVEAELQVFEAQVFAEP